MSWLPISYDETTGQGTYFMRMAGCLLAVFEWQRSQQADQ
jgi:hypothetical protein